VILSEALTYLTYLISAVMFASMERFHAHVYFPPEALDLARTLAITAENSNIFGYVGVYENPIGPHPTGMIEMHFTQDNRDRATDWLVSHRETFSVLVHRVTVDDFQDHTQDTPWL